MDANFSSMYIHHHFLSNPDKPIPNSIYLKQFSSLNHGFAVKFEDYNMRHKVLDKMPDSHHTFAWNTLIQTHLRSGDFDRAVTTYHQMLLKGVRPDKHTLPRILSVSRLLGCLQLGKQLHGQAIKNDLSSSHYVHSALLELYGRLDGAEAAKRVFDKSLVVKSTVSWTLLAKLYVKEGKPNLAIELFNEMVRSNTEIDSLSLATAIGACGLLKSLQEGRNVHRIAKSCELEFDVLVSNSLLKMYIDCGSIREARLVFDQMKSRDKISWTAMVSGYVQKGEFNEGLKLFRQMNAEYLKPDVVSVSSVLPACGRMPAYKNGKEIHGYLLRNGIDMNIKVQNALTDMYVKSGLIDYASEIYSRMSKKDNISWTVMILGYSLHGKGELGVKLFQEIVKSSTKDIDWITQNAVLYACCTAIMVEEGQSVFNCIRSPKVATCALMVALLARAGLFDEARSLIEGRQIARQAEVLRAFLDGCRVNQNISAGKRVIEQLCELEPLNADNYVLLSNLYACAGKPDMVEELKETIRDMALTPKKAYSWIEFRNKVHVFGTGDVTHPRSEKIYWELKCLMSKMEEEDGIMPNTDFSLHDVDEERECIPIGHSELLAMSFGLISTQAGETIRVTKNLRVCRNCHQFAKVTSKISGREIIIKDNKYFHHFKDGSCSCRDF
ncbi:pentatricopeptide repeat-containing protein DOT4, chloroplastic-like [Apium graveolens]|uniref:pentatricopeptide repeat-containing protein DOT4, chloroplastic-like n=1 Tax=Apium graveolens TaxID=4045 RepID=UPI003D7C0D4B